MSDNRPAEEVDVTKEWRATQGQKSAATRLRIFAAIAWLIAIGGEVAGIVLLRQGRFDQGNLPLLIGILVGIAVFAIAGSLMWKAANKHDPASKSEPFKFFVQNQLGAIITLIAFLPLVVLIFMDKDMDPKNKKIAGGIGAVLAVAATLIGVSWNPPSVEQYTEDMNTCAAQIKANQPTTACSPEVAEQAIERMVAVDDARESVRALAREHESIALQHVNSGTCAEVCGRSGQSHAHFIIARKQFRNDTRRRRLASTLCDNRTRWSGKRNGDQQGDERRVG